ncbi:MAG: ABC transporter ATP-binding protein [Peptococcaceae bacterium]|nr:ABC transporter ATP-binding protein [Peptococcaceae bacterium]
MAETILRVNQVSKTMGRRLIIDQVSFETYAGEVFGFLGPNGAGKTTTIKMIMGLLDIDAGDVEICDINVRKRFEKAIANAGGIVENPETYTYLTGLQNLRQYKRMRTGVTDDRIDEVVKLVGLENRIKDKVKRYSLGMKQRLGLAQALLHKPKLLILDEPTNGLDPAGIRELRDLMKQLAGEQGISVLVSSHLLSEMELMCDRVGIISNGRIIGVKTIKELMEQTSGKQKIYRFTVNDVAKAVGILSSNENLTLSNTTPQTFEAEVEHDDIVGQINSTLIGAGITLMGVAPVERSLEDVFIEITGGGGEQIA